MNDSDDVSASFARPATVAADGAEAAAQSDTAPVALRTPLELRRAVQELLKHGWLEQEAKPRLFETVRVQAARINTLLEPLDLQVQIDEVRGLVFARVLPDYVGAADGAADDEAAETADDWSHPLVFRQRLTLEQSLLVAILRREFIQQEQEGGLGVAVRLALDDLLPQLDVFIPRSGSDAQDRKRLLQSLENLRKHGVVSEVDANDYLLIRPMIVHLANPENLQALLLRLQTLASQRDGAGADASAAAPEREAEPEDDAP